MAAAVWLLLIWLAVSVPVGIAAGSWLHRRKLELLRRQESS